MDEGSRLFVDRDTGRIVDEPLSTIPYEVRDLKGLILAPAFLELQTNGCAGVHFTVFEDASTYHENLRMVSKYLATTGVGAFLATIPTVSSDVFSKVGWLYSLPFIFLRRWTSCLGFALYCYHHYCFDGLRCV